AAARAVTRSAANRCPASRGEERSSAATRRPSPRRGRRAPPSRSTRRARPWRRWRPRTACPFSSCAASPTAPATRSGCRASRRSSSPTTVWRPTTRQRSSCGYSRRCPRRGPAVVPFARVPPRLAPPSVQRRRRARACRRPAASGSSSPGPARCGRGPPTCRPIGLHVALRFDSGTRRHSSGTAGSLPAAPLPSPRAFVRRRQPSRPGNRRLLHLGQAGDDAPVLLLREGARGLDANVALRAERERQLHRRLVVRCLRDHDRVVLPGHEVELPELRAGGTECLLGRIEPGGSLLDPLDPLLREPEQRQIGGHRTTSLRGCLWAPALRATRSTPGRGGG